MIDLEEVDLAKALSRLSRRLATASADIVTELDSPVRTDELAGLLEDAVRQLRTWARAALPKVIEPHHGQETTVTEQDHTSTDEDLAATLTELLQRLRLVAPLLADQLANTLTEMTHRMNPADIAAGLGGGGNDAAQTKVADRPGVQPWRDNARGVQGLVEPNDAGLHAGRHRLRDPPRAPDGPSDGWGRAGR